MSISFSHIDFLLLPNALNLANSNSLDFKCHSIQYLFHEVLSLYLFLLYFYLYTQMNNRQVELQVIIRNLQNKILIQKQQNKILSERFDQRIRLMQQDYSRKLYEKDRMIEYLTLELQKDRQIILNQQYLYDSKRVKQKQEIYKEYDRYKQKSNELQKKLQAMIEKYELQKKDLQTEIKKYQEKEYDQSFSRASIETQIQKLNKFYHQSRIDQPKRRDLVEWVDKLSNLIQRTESQNNKTLEELFAFIKNNLQSFKSQLLHSLNSSNDFQEQMLKSKKQILHELKEIIKEQNKVKNDLLENNDRLLQILRKEKANSQAEKISELEKEVMEYKKKANENLQEYNSKIKNLQSERKTLLLGFTQLKTLNESRQKLFKEQINSLKQTIQSLLQNGQKRQEQFQKQIKVLHNQLTAISERYYQNIQVPLSKFTSKLDNQIKTARVQLQKLSQNKHFIKTIENLEQIMQNYIVENASTFKLNETLGNYISKSKEMVVLAHQIFQSENQRQLLSKSNQNEELDNTDGLHNKVNAIELNIKEVQWKERENKLLYELITAKKYNKKLKEYCQNLQGKSNTQRNVSPIKNSRIGSTNNVKNTPGNAKQIASSSNVKNSNNSNNSSTNPIKPLQNTSKIYELQAQIQRLTLLNTDYAQQFLFQLASLKQHIRKLTGKQVKDEKNLMLMQKGLKQISEFNYKVEEYLQRQDNHVSSIKQIVHIVNKMLLRPVEIFDHFLQKFTSCYQTSSNNFQTHSFEESHQSSYVKLFARLQQAYKEIYSKKQQNNAQTTKLFLQFIRILRESIPNNQKTTLKISAPNQSQKQGFLERSRLSRESGIEKKIKDLQNLKMKSREETIKKLQKIQESIKNIDSKYSKRHFVNLGRIQESVCRKIDEVREKCIQKLKDSNIEVNEITGVVLKDIKNKLKLCMSQNEGLTKQVQLLQKFKKKQ